MRNLFKELLNEATTSANLWRYKENGVYNYSHVLNSKSNIQTTAHEIRVALRISFFVDHWRSFMAP